MQQSYACIYYTPTTDVRGHLKLQNLIVKQTPERNHCQTSPKQL